MRAVETFISGALVLIGLYLLFNSQQASSIIKELAAGSSRIIYALQGQKIQG